VNEQDERTQAALEHAGFMAYEIGLTRVYRSPDRTLFILSDFCDADDVVTIVERYQAQPANLTIKWQ
jgi:hypothetical protein